MATEAPTQDEKRQRRLKRRTEQQPDNSDGFSQWFTESNADGQYDEKEGRYTSGKYRGKTLNEATAMARDEFAALNKSTPGFADKWGARARGNDVSQGPRAMGQLPENMRGMPNAPDLSGFQQFDKQGRQVAGPSPSARQRFMDSVQQGAVRAQTAKQAVQDRKAWQQANPGAVADMSIAANDARLAESGITDMGGGTKAMSNQYGTGFATNMTPQEAADRKAGKTFGTIMDEKGVVDVKGMMANKGKGTTTPYVAGSQDTPALNMDARDANRAAIQAKTIAAMPGAEDRRAADRVKATNAITATNASNAVGEAVANFTPKTMWSPWNAAIDGPAINAGSQVGVDSANTALSAAGLQRRAVLSPIDIPPLGTASKPDSPSTEQAPPKTTQGLPFAMPAASGSQPANTSTPATGLPFEGPQPATAPAAPATQKKAGRFGGARSGAPQPANPQVDAIKQGVKAVPSNIMAGLGQSYDGMKRTIFGS
jgi:hypothetical protein